MRTWLIDTGPFIAYISRTDPMHARVAARVDGFITEVMYFLSGVPAGPVSFAELLLASGTHVAESAQPQHVLAAAELMRKYADTPMDFADATLVQLAEELGVMDILTLDRRGFSTYRTAKGKAFRLVL
jgi:predicted nucleic acid-binding protein